MKITNPIHENNTEKLLQIRKVVTMLINLSVECCKQLVWKISSLN